MELARSQMKTKADKSARNDKKQAEALARTQKALEQKNIQVEELTRQMEELKTVPPNRPAWPPSPPEPLLRTRKKR